MSTTHKDLAAELYAAARLHIQASDTAYTLEDEDTRRRNASQLRFVAALTAAGPGMDQMAEAWLSASGTMLSAYAETDAAREQLALVASGYGTGYYQATADALSRMHRPDQFRQAWLSNLTDPRDVAETIHYQADSPEAIEMTRRIDLALGVAQ